MKLRPVWRRAAVFAAVALMVLVVFVSCRESDNTKVGVFEADFDDYRGTRSTMPAGMFVSGENDEGDPVGPAFYPFAGVFEVTAAAEAFSGFGAFTADGESFSFGIRERGEVDLRNARVFIEYTNETGRPIVGFRVSYDVETWIQGERDNRIRLKYHTDTSGFASVRDIVSTVNPAGALHSAAGARLVDGSLAENRTRVDVAFLLGELEAHGEDGLYPYGPLEPEETAYFRWQYSNAQLTDGDTRSALALNNVRVEPIYEHSAAGGAARGAAANGAARDGNAAEGAGSTSETTHGSPEAAGSARETAAPSPLAFDPPAGIYGEAVPLTISSSLEGATIYYTVDGSRPDPDAVMSDAEWDHLGRETRTRTFVYEAPIDTAGILALQSDISTIQTSNETGPWSWVAPPEAVERALVVRAVAVSGPNSSAHRTATLLFAEHANERFELPVFSIATDRGNFFDPETGIYVPGVDAGDDFWQSNFLNRGTDWEREAHLEFFDGGVRVLRQDLGLRIHGNFSRALPQKTLRLYSRSDYGSSRLNHQFFDEQDLDDFNRLLLRNGGNDWYRTMLTDPIQQSLVAHLDFETQAYRPTILFLNGEYWGIHNIRERYDQHYLETHYGLPRDQIIILEDDGFLDVGDEAYVDTFTRFRGRLADGEFSSWMEVDRYLDLGAYLDYLVAKIYAGNYDWPQNNIRLWRYVGEDVAAAPSPRDGRWRVMMYDLDVSLGHGESATYNMVAWTFGDKDEHPFLPEGEREFRADSFVLNQALMEIPEIRTEFLRRFDEHLDTTFHPDRVGEHIERITAGVEAEMPRHIERWSRPSSMDEWRAHIEAMHEFARERPARVRDHLREFFGEDAL
ncbi:MAG: hypothetical protein EA383_17375 [Spirochaetaceae bacterium]|nr:MAG: hypothetical protein EA383_17375 [Spirochaetaceae bacterium]